MVWCVAVLMVCREGAVKGQIRWSFHQVSLIPHLDVNQERTSILSSRSHNKVGSWAMEEGEPRLVTLSKVSQPSLGKPRCHPLLFSLRNQLPWECEMEHGISKLPELPGPSVQDRNVEGGKTGIKLHLTHSRNPRSGDSSKSCLGLSKMDAAPLIGTG
ncbi:hypothetical protein F5Y12DRAFT_766766 [Xylaria sp. FL1777]|nr:hypothetical protein F5Y12DRAFT_766766 [Xylaria sp. FL1777]